MDASSTPEMPQVDDLVAAKYRIVSIIGEGGYGIVYRAYQETMRRDVAIKMLRPSVSAIRDEVERFRREVYNASCLKHPHTITLYDYGQTAQGALFIVMEYLEGMNLRHWIHHRGVFTHDDALVVVEQLLRSLREAHNQGIIHRDLKPENIFLTHIEEGELFIKVLDFGLSKAIGATKRHPRRRTLTKQGQVFGTPQYMSPEQAMGKALTPASDVYAVGVLTWEMLAGRPPFDGKKPVDILLQHVNNPLPPVPAAHEGGLLDQFIARATDKDPDTRFADAGEALAWLNQQKQERARPTIVAIPHGAFQPSIKMNVVPPPATPAREVPSLEWSSRMTSLDAAEVEMRLAQLPLVGRGRELEAMTRWGRQAMLTGGVMWLTGEAGVGKTRLLEEWTRQMERQAPIQLHGVYREQASPMEGLRAALSPLLPPSQELALRIPGGAVDPEEAREVAALLQPHQRDEHTHTGQDWAFVRVEQFLYRVAQARPVMLVLENVQWADTFTTRLIEHWQDDLAMRAVPLILVLTQRGVEQRPQSQQLNNMSRLVRTVTQTSFSYQYNLHLDRLDDTSALELLDEAVPFDDTLRARILQASRGNPLYLTQIVRYLFDEQLVKADTEAHIFRMSAAAGDDPNLLPPDLQALMIRRVLVQLQEHRLGVVLRALLARAMVLGQRFETRLFKEMLRREGRGDLEGYFDDALEAFAQSGVLVSTVLEGKPGLEFGFELLRHDVLERTLLDDGRELAELHAYAAQTKEGFYKLRDAALLDVHALEIATHWSRSGNRTQGFEWLMRAAKVTERAQDFRTALTCLRQASAMLDERLDPDGEFQLEIRLAEGRMFRNLGQYGPAEESLREAVEETRRVGDTVGEAITGEALANLLVLMTRYDEASALYESIRPLYGQFERAGQVRCDLGMGELARYRGRYREALTRFTEALEEAEQLDDLAIQARCLYGLGQCAYAAGQLAAATERFRQARKLAEVLGDALLRSSTDVELALVALSNAHVEDAIALAQQALDVKRELGDTLGMAHAHLILGMALLYTTRQDQADMHMLRSRTLSERLSHVYGIAKAVLLGSELALARGDVREATRLMDDSIRLHEEIGDAHGMALALLQRAQCALSMDRPEDVELSIERVDDLSRVHGLELYQPVCLYMRGKTLERRGRVREASMCYESGLRLAEDHNQHAQIARHTVGLVRTRLVLGDMEAAMAEVPIAIARAEAANHAPPLAQALVLGSLLARLTRDASMLSQHLRRLRGLLQSSEMLTAHVARTLVAMAEHIQPHQRRERAFAVTLSIIELLRSIRANAEADDLASRLLRPSPPPPAGSS